MPRGRFGLAALALVLVAGCSAGFDPDADGPCDFFSSEELERYELTEGEVATDADGEAQASCRFDPNHPDDGERGSNVERVNVAYLPWQVTEVEEQWQEWEDAGVVIEEVDESDSRLAYRFGYALPEDTEGSESSEEDAENADGDTHTDDVAECRLIADRDEGSVVVRLGMFDVTDNACTVLADSAPEIEEKLAR